MDHIQVAIRVRPLIQREVAENSQLCWQVEDSTKISQIGSPSGYTFDRVYDSQENNSVVYVESCSTIVESVMQGFNGTVFAYGQTSSGKTFTMKSITESCVTDIFEAIDRMPEKEFLIRVSYMEIYNETVSDLLDPSNKNVKVMEEVNGNVINLTEIDIKKPTDVLKVIQSGEKHRSVGETNMNKTSSRSHAIFRMIIESRMRDSDVNKGISVSHLNLVDLAGSERAHETAAVGDRLKESKSINKSLHALSKVIGQLSSAATHVNYRDSKLTRILRNSLGGNARTVILCMVTPASRTQTSSTLQFANNARRIKNEPVVNLVLSNEAKLNRVHTELAALSKQLEEMRNNEGNRDELKKELSEKNKENEELLKQIRELKEKFIVSRLQLPQDIPGPSRRETWCFGRTNQKRNLTPILENSPSADLEEKVFEPLDGCTRRRLTAEMKSDVQFLDSGCQTSDESTKKLESELKTVMKEKTALQTALNKTRKELEELKEFTVLEKDTQLTDLIENNELLKEENSQLKDELKKLEEKISETGEVPSNESSAIIEMMNKEMSEMETQMIACVEKVKMATERDANTINELTRLRDEDHESFLQEGKRLQDINQKLFDAFQKERDFVNEVSVAAVRKLENKTAIIERKNKFIVEMQARFLTYRNDVSKRLEEDKNDLAMMDEDRKKLQKEKEALVFEIKELQFQNNRLTLSKTHLETEVDGLKSVQTERRLALEKALSDQEIRKKHLNESLEVLGQFQVDQNERLDLLSQHFYGGEDLRVQIESLKKENRNLKPEHNSIVMKLEGQIIEMKTQIEELKNSQEDKLEVRSDISMFENLKLCSKCNTAESTTLGLLEYKNQKLEQEIVDLTKDRNTYREKMNSYIAELRRVQNVNTSFLDLKPSRPPVQVPRKTLQEALKTNKRDVLKPLGAENHHADVEHEPPKVQNQRPIPKTDADCKQQ